MGPEIVCLRPGRTNLDLCRVGADEQDGIWPDGKRSVFDPDWLNVAELVPADGCPRASRLDFFETEDGDLSGGFMFTFDPG